VRISISNLAWDPNEDGAIASLLQRYTVDAIDVAPGKYFPNFSDATDQDIARVKQWWNERGIDVIGMQSLLFGKPGFNVFGDAETRQQMLDHLTQVCRIGAGLGATWLVFGSPKNRDRQGLNDAETLDIAVPFFQKLGDIAQSYQVILCLEPNPPCYGANFMTTAKETAQVVAQINHPAVRMQFDTGALTINQEDATEVLSAYAELLGHIHASEPNLLPLGDLDTDHGKLADMLRKYFPEKTVSIEMLATRAEDHLSSVERALNVAIQHYRSPYPAP